MRDIWRRSNFATIFFCSFKTDAKELNKVIPEKLDIRKNENKNSLTSFKACPEVLIQAIFRQDLQFWSLKTFLFYLRLILRKLRKSFQDTLHSNELKG